MVKVKGKLNTLLYGAGMRKTALALALILALSISAVAGAQFVNLGRANPFAPIPAPVHPKITILSPEDNTLHASNALTVTLTVSINFEKGWSYLIYVNCKVSWQQDIIAVYEHPRDDDYYPSEFSYKLNLTGIPEGKQTVMISAGGGGGYHDEIYGLLLFDDAYSSTSVSFTIASVSILSPQNKTYDTSDVPLLFKTRESFTQISYSLDGQNKVIVSGNTTLTDVPIGEHNVTLNVMDEAGNTGASETLYFSVVEVAESFPIAYSMGIVAVIVLVLLGAMVYILKRKD